MTTFEEKPDGTRTWYVDEDALAAAAFLDYEGAPELTEEQFDELTEEVRKAKDEVGVDDDGPAGE